MDQTNSVQNQNSNQPDQQIPVRSNTDNINEQTIVAPNSNAYSTEELKAYVKKKPQKIKETNEPDNKPWLIDQRKGAKVYELVGYTTVGKVDQTFEKRHRQNVLKRFLITILLIIIIFLLFIILNPFKAGTDFNRILGINSKYSDEEMRNQTYNTVQENNSESDSTN